MLELFLASPSDTRTIDRSVTSTRREGYRKLSDMLSARIRGLRTSQNNYPILDEAAWPPSDGANKSKHAYFMLRPIPKESALPILRLSYDFKKKPLRPAISMRVLLFMHHNSEIKAQGFRFESPEGDGSPSEEESTHNYFHTQQITSFEKNDGRFSGEVVPWMLVSQPAFCLDASTPVQLAVNFFVSLYGLTEVKTTLRGQRVWSEIKGDLESMHIKPRFAKL